MESLGVPRIPHQRLCAQLVLSLGDNGQCLGTYVAVICHICARNRWRPGSPPHPDSVCMAGRTLVHTGGTDLVISHPPPGAREPCGTQQGYSATWGLLQAL